MSHRRAIVHALRSAEAPLRFAEIAHALSLPHSDELREELRGLVRDGTAQRHHHPDGVLRYSLTDSAPRARRAPAKDAHVSELTRARMDRIQSVIAGYGDGVRVGTVRAALSDLTAGQFSYLLGLLVSRGDVTRAGKSYASRLSLRRDEAVQVSAIDGRNLNAPPPTDFILDALRASATASQTALDAYLARRQLEQSE